MVVSQPDYAKSGTYWSWSNPPESEAYCNVLSEEASVRFSNALAQTLIGVARLRACTSPEKELYVSGTATYIAEVLGTSCCCDSCCTSTMNHYLMELWDVQDMDKAAAVFDVSEKLVGLKGGTAPSSATMPSAVPA